MLLALGLGCTVDDDTFNACLSTTADGPGTSSTTGNGSVSATSTSGPSTSTTTTGPCLDVDIGPCLFDIGSPETTTGPCLSETGPCLEPPSDTGFTSSSGSDSGSGSDTGTATGTSTGGGMLDEPPPAARAAAVDRVLSRGVLPPDVAARLRGHRHDP
jgi:hypothetical protein